jgi:hypothetical protein
VMAPETRKNHPRTDRIRSDRFGTSGVYSCVDSGPHGVPSAPGRKYRFDDLINGRRPVRSVTSVVVHAGPGVASQHDASE